MKFMLPLPPYHTIYLIVKLFRISLMLIRLIGIGPFIDTISTVYESQTSLLPIKY